MLSVSNDISSTRDESEVPLKQSSSNHLGTAFSSRSNTFEGKLRVEKRNWIWIVSSHIMVSGILIATIILGAIGETYHFNDSASFIFFRLSIDNQMFFFGIFSKAADYVLNDSIARITGVLLTVWMSQPTRFPGVIPLDFELSEEMAKPWIAVWNAVKRWRLDPPKNKLVAVIRVILSLASGFAVLLLGGSINVLAMPKLRWTPGRSVVRSVSQGMYIDVNTTRINDINWAHVDAAYSNRFSAITGDTILAASVLQALANLDNMYIGFDTVVGVQEYVIFHTIQRGIPAQIQASFESPVLAVRGRGFSMGRPNATADVRTISIQEGPIYDFWMADTTSEYGVKAVGARSWVNFTVPILSTTCEATNGPSAVDVDVNVSTASQVSVSISGSNSSSGFSCTSRIAQTVHPIYFYNSSSDSRDEVNVPAMGLQGVSLSGLPFDDANSAIARSLATKLNTTLSRMESLTGISFATLAHQLASKVSTSQNLSYPAAMSYVVGLTAQHLITIAAWSESPSALRHRSGPIQWQLYGSGPRLEWQWIIAVIVGFTFTVLLYDLYLLIIRRIQSGPWLSVPGMMMAANSTEKLSDFDDDIQDWRVGEVTERVERAKIFLRKDNTGTPSLRLEEKGSRRRLGTRRAEVDH